MNIEQRVKQLEKSDTALTQRVIALENRKDDSKIAARALKLAQENDAALKRHYGYIKEIKASKPSSGFFSRLFK